MQQSKPHCLAFGGECSQVVPSGTEECQEVYGVSIARYDWYTQTLAVNTLNV